MPELHDLTGRLVIYYDHAFHHNRLSGIDTANKSLEEIPFSGYISRFNPVLDIYNITPLHHLYQSVQDFTEWNENIEEGIRELYRHSSQIRIISASDDVVEQSDIDQCLPLFLQSESPAVENPAG